jgi:hypothetical protein
MTSKSIGFAPGVIFAVAIVCSRGMESSSAGAVDLEGIVVIQF